jgi:DoxX-like family
MLDIALWVAQGFLALFFLGAGIPKVIGRGIDRWVGFDDLPRSLTILIGVTEVAGAVALVLPPLVGIFEWLSPLAAIGIAVISLMASGFHIRAAEGLPAIETALWAVLAASVAIGRWGEFANGPSLSSDALVVAIALLILLIIVILVLLTRRPVEPRSNGSTRHTMAAR